MAGTGYSRQSTFTDGDTVTADLFNDEYNQLENSFIYAASGTIGHQHDGSSGQGGNIYVIGDQDFFNKIEVDTINNRWGFYISVSDTAVEQVRLEDGVFLPVIDNDIDLGSATYQFKDAYINGTAYIDAIDFNGTLITATGTELNYVDGVTSNIQTQLDAKQPIDSDLTAIAALSNTDGNFIVGNGTTWVAESGATARTSLGLTIGTDVQAYSSVLAATTASFTTADETKLDGIEALADVTDATNVAAAGAVMDGDFSSNGLMSRTGAGTYSVVTNNSSNWNTAYSWGDHSLEGYLTSETYTGTVTSVAATVPTGFTVSGTPVTTSGTLAFGFDTGYSLPTTANQTNWNTAYGWGDHSTQGYLTGITGQSIKNLSDVYSSMTPSDGQVLTYDTINGWQAETLPAGSGTVTSVAATVPTGFTISGSPITTSGTLAVSFDTGYSLPTTASQTNWNTAYGWGDHTSAGYLTSETYTGTVTSVAFSGGTTGLTVSGSPITSSGTITLSGTLAVANGGTGTTTSTGSGSVVLGTSPSITSPSVTGTILEDVYALSGTTPAFDPDNGSVQTWTLSGNSTPTDSLSAGEAITLMIDDGTAYTITWPTMTWVNNAAAAPTLAATGYTVVALWKVSTTLYGALVGDGS